MSVAPDRPTRLVRHEAPPLDQHSSVAHLLDRLDAVRETGLGRWLARCPAHDDRVPSLSIRDADERVLVHCFAGCRPGDVVTAVGLELQDLFPPSLDAGTHFCPPTRRRIPAADALAAIDYEAQVVTVIASDVLQHREVDSATWARLALAVRRISAARDLCGARTMRP